MLKPGGQLVIFNSEFATLTVHLFKGDPLQSTVDGVLRHMMHAPYIMRRLPALVAAAGFSVQTVEPHGYVQTTCPDFLLTLLSRGASAAARAGEISPGLVDGLPRKRAGGSPTAVSTEPSCSSVSPPGRTANDWN